MSRSPDPADTATVSEQQQGQSVARLRLPPQQSDVRALGAAPVEGDVPFELGTRPRMPAPLQPPPLDVSAALVDYGGGLPAGSAALEALKLGDLPFAVVLLLQANHRLCQELEAIRADFDELRAVNLAIQDRMDDTLGVADDQRLQLLEELERNHDAMFELENQRAQEHVLFESELGRCQAEREELEAELRDLKQEFSDYQARLWK